MTFFKNKNYANLNCMEQITSEQFLRYARSGGKSDVDFLMEFLHPEQTFLICKMIDHALGEVRSHEGQNRIRYYLFGGKFQIQRNYAALYFKRIGAMFLLEEAVEKGCIDRIQAYAR